MTKQNISFEFFPAKTLQGREKLLVAAEQLNNLQPDYVSVTFGAGGSTREGTPETVFQLQEELQLDVAPHISGLGSTKAEIIELLNVYQQHDINRLVVLRGDMPSGMGGVHGDFRYANELVEFIRAETGDNFIIEVGCYPEFHPQATDPYSDIENFQRKIESGADSAITQYFYNPDAYFRFVDECRAMQIKVDIVPGIMPITNYQQIARFSNMCGAEIPRWISQRLQALEHDKESLLLFGEEVVTELCETLIENDVPGLHFYTLNKAKPTLNICKNLGFSG